MELRIVRLASANSQRHLCDGEPHFLCVCAIHSKIHSITGEPLRSDCENKRNPSPECELSILSALNCDITENMHVL